MIRFLLGGVVGGVVMFVSDAVAHMVLPRSKMGSQSMSNFDLSLTALATVSYQGLGVGGGRSLASTLD